MNHYFTAFITTLLVGTTQGALAASAVDLTVKGTLTPVACTPGLSNNGLVDYGKISYKDLNVDKRTQLQDRHLDFTIQCDGPERFALVMRDNRDGSAIVSSEIY